MANEGTAEAYLAGRQYALDHGPVPEFETLARRYADIYGRGNLSTHWLAGYCYTIKYGKGVQS